MTALPPDKWQPLPPGELDRLQLRLRWRRWLRNAATIAVVTGGLAVGGWGDFQGMSLLLENKGPSTSGCNSTPKCGSGCCTATDGASTHK